MSRRANPFSPGTVLAMLLVGSLAFLLLLYSLGQGWTGGENRDGGSHAASNGLNGYSGLAALLESAGSKVTLTRSQAELQDYGLQILTPPLFSDVEEIDAIIERRMNYAAGPTVLILPKWMAMPVPDGAGIESPDGWVMLLGAVSPGWFGDLEITDGTSLAVGETGGWQGFGLEGDLPDESQVQALVGDRAGVMRPLVVDDEGDLLAAELVQQGGYDDYDPWPVIVVFEPDLLNNYGMADRDRAQAAMRLVESATLGETMPVRFDLTLNGLGAAENLLTLAFRPPFLAATLCMLLAALVIGWRAFRRFGPPVAEAPAMAQGKRQLARNGAALLERVKRWHLLTGPYEDMTGRRLARALGLRDTDGEHREAAIDMALQRRGHDGPTFSRLAADLREAHNPKDIVRAARALRSFERTLTP
ncbi:DUF4350 domain-containing protein [Aurantiacibacter hainanensis]|uniref:DUF4350 domain-containing protein n=1 Tax=Aurantiacibacter hainanensis TaxID=3076114 RepID=UPI0030C6C6B3